MNGTVRLHTYNLKRRQYMISSKQTTPNKQDSLPLTNLPPVVIKESRKQPTTSNLIRWTGLAAIVAGIIFAGIQPIHPPDVLSSVNTTAWAIITPLKTIMCLLFLLGIA